MRIDHGEVVAGRYVLEKPLARGGMGAVWVARHQKLDSPVAIKFMDPAFASSLAARSRFEREAKAAAQIHSPHVVHVYDYGIEDDTPYLVMELLEGEDLGARLKRAGFLSLEVTADLLLQISRALRTAHASGIIHRDLKPGNIFLAQNHDVVVAKVLDFGIAKTSKLTAVDETTKSDQILGSPQYMSPEQARRSRDVDPRSDLWSLGIIAYRAITGRLPFAGQDLGDVLVKICTEPAPAPSAFKPDLPPTLDRFFERALAKSPDHRFATPSDLAAAFMLAAGLNLPAELSHANKLMRTTIPIRNPAVPVARSPAVPVVRRPPPLPRSIPSARAESDETTRPREALPAALLTPEMTTEPREHGPQRSANALAPMANEPKPIANGMEPPADARDAAVGPAKPSSPAAPPHWTAGATSGSLAVSSVDIVVGAAAEPVEPTVVPVRRRSRVGWAFAAVGVALSLSVAGASYLSRRSVSAIAVLSATPAEGSPPTATEAVMMTSVPGHDATAPGAAPSASVAVAEASPDSPPLADHRLPAVDSTPALRPVRSAASSGVGAQGLAPARSPWGSAAPPKKEIRKPKDPLQDM